MSLQITGFQGGNCSHPLQIAPCIQGVYTSHRDRAIEGAGHTHEQEISPDPKLTHSLHNYILTQIFLRLGGSCQIQGLPSLPQTDLTPANSHPDPAQLP